MNIKIIQVATNHHLHHALAGYLSFIQAARIGPVSQHGHAVRYFDNFAEPMRDIDHADSL